MNPWSPEHWIFTEFFKGRLEPTAEYMESHMWADYKDDNFVGPFGKGLYLHQSNYKINEFRDVDTWDMAAAGMKERSYELYKPNFLGLFGATTGLAYPEFSNACCTTVQKIMEEYEFCDFSIGVDTGLSSGEGKKINVKKNEDPNLKIRSATTMALVGITRGYEKIVVIDEYFHSNDKSSNFVNTDNTDDLTHPQLLDQIVQYIIKWSKKYSSRPKNNDILMRGTIRVYVDSADQATIDGLRMKLTQQYGMYNVQVLPSTKISIQSRVDFERLMMAYSDFIVCAENCPNVVRELKSARKGEKGEARAPGNDHMLDSESYAWQPFRQSIVRWKTQFKEH